MPTQDQAMRSLRRLVQKINTSLTEGKASVRELEDFKVMLQERTEAFKADYQPSKGLAQPMVLKASDDLIERLDSEIEKAKAPKSMFSNMGGLFGQKKSAATSGQESDEKPNDSDEEPLDRLASDFDLESARAELLHNEKISYDEYRMRFEKLRNAKNDHPELHKLEKDVAAQLVKLDQIVKGAQQAGNNALRVSASELETEMKSLQDEIQHVIHLTPTQQLDEAIEAYNEEIKRYNDYLARGELDKDDKAFLAAHVQASLDELKQRFASLTDESSQGKTSNMIKKMETFLLIIELKVADVAKQKMPEVHPKELQAQVDLVSAGESSAWKVDVIGAFSSFLASCAKAFSEFWALVNDTPEKRQARAFEQNRKALAEERQLTAALRGTEATDLSLEALVPLFERQFKTHVCSTESLGIMISHLERALLDPKIDPREHNFGAKSLLDRLRAAKQVAQSGEAFEKTLLAYEGKLDGAETSGEKLEAGALKKALKQFKDGHPGPSKTQQALMARAGQVLEKLEQRLQPQQRAVRDASVHQDRNGGDEEEVILLEPRAANSPPPSPTFVGEIDAAQSGAAKGAKPVFTVIPQVVSPEQAKGPVLEASFTHTTATEVPILEQVERQKEYIDKLWSDYGAAAQRENSGEESLEKKLERIELAVRVFKGRVLVPKSIQDDWDGKIQQAQDIIAQRSQVSSTQADSHVTEGATPVDPPPSYDSLPENEQSASPSYAEAMKNDAHQRERELNAFLDEIGANESREQEEAFLQPDQQEEAFFQPDPELTSDAKAAPVETSMDVFLKELAEDAKAQKKAFIDAFNELHTQAFNSSLNKKPSVEEIRAFEASWMKLEQSLGRSDFAEDHECLDAKNRCVLEIAAAKQACPAYQLSGNAELPVADPDSNEQVAPSSGGGSATERFKEGVRELFRGVEEGLFSSKTEKKDISDDDAPDQKPPIDPSSH